MKVLMYFHGGSGNRGCEAIVVSAIKVIKQKYPKAYVALASGKPDTDNHINDLDEIIFHNQNRKIKAFSPLFFKNYWNVKLLKSQSVSYQLIHKDIIDRIDDFDIFLSIGGDNYCYGTIPDYYELNRLIKSKGKKLILWGASLGQEDLNPEKLNDLKIFDHLNIRESVSESQLRAAGLSNTKLVADGAFLLDKELLPLPQEWQEGNTIGFNYSPLVENKIPESRASVIRLLQHMLSVTNYTIAFTPHVIQAGNNDHECMQRLINDLGTIAHNRVFLLPDNLTAAQYKGYISRMEMFIGARTHATIAAYSTAVPVMVLGYSIKSLGIAKDLFAYPRLVLDKSELSNSDLLIEKFEELNTDKAAIREHLEKIVPDMRSLAMSANQYL